MDERTKSGISRVAKGESVDEVLHALLGEAQLGDPAELERLYGGDFNSRGQIDHSAHNDEELEVPTHLRRDLVNHGYHYTGMHDAGTKHERHTYDDHSKSRVSVILHPLQGLIWSHKYREGIVRSGVGTQGLLDHLKQFHS